MKWGKTSAFIIFLSIIHIVLASGGDRSQFFLNCVRGCRHSNCTDDGINFKKTSLAEQSYTNKLLLWSCHDECVYSCMWRTTNSFVARNWNVPQFYGKWPFKRFYGIQEPASAFFSLLNLVVHVKMMRKFREEVRSDSPMYYIWHIFCVICINGWICSIIFHTRDFPITELLDYGFAYSMVLANFGCMILRVFYWTSKKIKASIALTLLLFFINHFVYLSVGRFDYQYNMRANIATGIITGSGWIIWYFLNKQQPHAWKILLFQIIVGISLLLEVNDFAPIFWVFDAHSLWHLSTVMPTVLLYSFLIDDTKRLRQEKLEIETAFDEEKEKLI